VRFELLINGESVCTAEAAGFGVLAAIATWARRDPTRFDPQKLSHSSLGQRRINTLLRSWRTVWKNCTEHRPANSIWQLSREVELDFRSVVHPSIDGAREISMNVKDGAFCKVIAGTHKGKSGTVRDINTSKTGQVTITVVQKNGERFKTLAKNVEV
jgi:hypothetical protein